MKKLTYIALLLVTSLTTVTQAFAQQNQKALYIHRNDGSKIALRFNRIDSIVYSNIGIDSVVNESYNVQEFWTEDSVYRISIDQIDSVSFVTPKTKYQPDAKLISDELRNYVLSSDSLSFILDKNIPQNLIPSIGDKIVTTEMDDKFPVGFVGMVNSIDETTDEIIVKCDKISLTDVFSRYYSTFETLAVTQEDSANNVKMTRVVDGYFDVPPITFTPRKNTITLKRATDLVPDLITVGGGATYSFETSLQIKSNGFLIIDEDGTEFFLTMICDVEDAMTADMFGEFAISKKFPTPKLKARLGPFIESNWEIGFKPSLYGTLSMGAEFTNSYTWYASFGYSSNNQQNMPAKFGVEHKGFEIKPNCISGTIGVSVGMYASTNLAILTDLFNKVELEAEGGLKFELGASITQSDVVTMLKTPSLYQSIYAQTNNFSVTPYLSGTLTGEIGPYSISASGDLLNFDPIIEAKLVPAFSNLQYTKNDDAIQLSSEVDGEVFPKIPVGFKVFDEESNEVYSTYNDIEYEQWAFGNSQFGQYTAEMPVILQANKTYHLYPVVKLFNIWEMLGYPSKEMCMAVTPYSDDVYDITSSSAICMGHLEDKFDLGCNYDVGFLFGTSHLLEESGRNIPAQLQQDKSFSANVTGLKEETKYYYCAYIIIDGQYDYGDVISFETSKNEEAVDLGLSVKWRGWNVGASSPEQSGDFYAWGETATKYDYTWDSYFESPYDSIGDWIGCATTTDITATDMDVATAELGPEWRMPTKAEMQELINNCTWEWTTQNGVNGYKVKSQVNNNYIFLPAAGNYDGSSIKNAGVYGGYWTSTPNEDTSKATAGNLYFYKDTYRAFQWTNRYSGRTIRPVLAY